MYELLGLYMYLSLPSSSSLLSVCIYTCTFLYMFGCRLKKYKYRSDFLTHKNANDFLTSSVLKISVTSVYE